MYSLETQRERQALPWVSRITPWAESGAKPLSHRGCPFLLILIYILFCLFYHQVKYILRNA